MSATESNGFLAKSCKDTVENDEATWSIRRNCVRRRKVQRRKRLNVNSLNTFEPSYDYWRVYRSCIESGADHRRARQNSPLSLCYSPSESAWKRTAYTITAIVTSFRVETGWKGWNRVERDFDLSCLFTHEEQSYLKLRLAIGKMQNQRRVCDVIP